MRTVHALLLAAASTLAFGAPPPESVRRDLQKAVHLRQPGERASAVDAALRGQDSAEAAQIAVDMLFEHEDAQLVLEAAVLAVAYMKDEGVVGVLRKAADSGPLLRRVRAIETLGRSVTKGSANALLPLAGDPDAAVRAAAATALGRKDDSGVPTLEAALSDPAWTVRSAAASSIARLSARRAIPALCKSIRSESGRLVDDFTVALANVSGRRFGPDPARYESWWAKEQGGAAATMPAAAPWQPPLPSFDSPVLVTRSRRILFVLSTAETMKDPVALGSQDPALVATITRAGADLARDLAAAKTKLDVARVHLRAMLRTLRDGVEFDVMAYAASPTFAFGRMTPADTNSRKRAEARIASLSPSGTGNLHGALVRVFDPRAKDPLDAEEGPDTVVLFSDGGLAEPGSTDPTEVAGAAIRANAVRQIRFLVVATGQSRDEVLGRLAAGPPEGASTSVP